MANFMKLAVNEQRKFRGEEPLTAAEFLKLMREKSAVVELDSKLDVYKRQIRWREYCRGWGSGMCLSGAPNRR